MKLDELEKRLKNTEDKLAEMSQKLATIEDIEKIKQLHYKYVNCLQFSKWEELPELFRQDSTLEFGPPEHVFVIKGLDNIVKVFEDSISKKHVGKDGDILVHPIITVNGNQAKGTWVFYLMYAHPMTHQSLFWIQGIYETEYAKENERWQFKYLKFKPRLEPPGGAPDPDDLYHFLEKHKS